MRVFKGALLAFAVVTTAAAQSPDPPIGETRLTVHTLLREDIFAGFLDNNMERVARAEQNIALLLQQRPARAGQPAGVEGRHRRAARRARARGRQAPTSSRKHFTGRARGLRRRGEGVVRQRRRRRRSSAAPTRSSAIDCRRSIAPRRGRRPTIRIRCCGSSRRAQVEKMPLHFKGELLSGMAQSAQRTGRAEESAQFVEKMLTMLANTPFEKTAQQWKADPASAATTNLTCKNCHAPGRLSAKLAALRKRTTRPQLYRGLMRSQATAACLNSTGRMLRRLRSPSRLQRSCRNPWLQILNPSDSRGYRAARDTARSPARSAGRSSGR